MLCIDHLIPYSKHQKAVHHCLYLALEELKIHKTTYLQSTYALAKALPSDLKAFCAMTRNRVLAWHISPGSDEAAPGVVMNLDRSDEFAAQAVIQPEGSASSKLIANSWLGCQ